MADNIDALQTINLDGLIQELQGEGDLDQKNIPYNFYTMNTKWVTITGHKAINILT